MSLEQTTISGVELTEEDIFQQAMARPLSEKIAQAIGLLQLHEPKGGYWLAYSGGKDSDVILELAMMAGVAFHAVYNVTTIDPPELVRYIKRRHPEVRFNRQPKALLVRVVEKGVPTRRMRWCCEEYKEHGGYGETKILGVRAAESLRRKGLWRQVTNHRKNDSVMICPIVYWSDADIWAFHTERAIPHCELYDEGFKRLGCIGCPLAGPKQQRIDFDRWPGYERAWMKAVERFWNRWHGVPLNRPKWTDVDELIGPPARAKEFHTILRDGVEVRQYLRYWRWFEDKGSWRGLWDWWITGTKSSATECQGSLLWTN